MEQLNIRNKTQLKAWIQWYRKGELNRLEQPVGKQYTYGKGPEYESELEKLKCGESVFKAAGRSAKKVQGDGKEVSPKIVVTW